MPVLKGGVRPFWCAVGDACRQLNERLAPYKARLPGVPFAALVEEAYLDRCDLSAHGWYATPGVTGFGGERPFNYFCYGAAVSEVRGGTGPEDKKTLNPIAQRRFHPSPGQPRLVTGTCQLSEHCNSCQMPPPVKNYRTVSVCHPGKQVPTCA